MAAETVTVLFTDLVGSTVLSSRLGPDAADELRRAHFGLLRGAVADAGGTEVKNLGDGLMIVFSTPSHSLSCAVAMQRAVDRHNRTSEHPLSVRIGISAGEAVVEDGDYFGEPVVEAARLCAAAIGGQILLADIVRILTRGRGHDITPLGEIELKGLPEPVATCELIWAPAAFDPTDSPIPLQQRVAAAPTVGFVGRAAEREKLDAALKAVVAGDGQRVVLISGEGGMGKTTLALEVARQAFSNGAVVLYGRCDEDLGIPYQPVVEALHHYAVNAPGEWLDRHDPERLSELSRVVPALAKRMPELPPPPATETENEVYRLFAAVSEVLGELALTEPVVFILDDLHWADRPTLQLLRVLASASLGRLLVLGTFRDADVSASLPLGEALAALRREPSVERVSLSGFNDLEVLGFMEAAAGHAMDESGLTLCHALYEETDGNPFFVREVLLHLVETQAIEREEDGRWVTTAELEAAGLPESVREVVGSRVIRLGVEAAAVLASAAVIGQEFDFELLCAMTDRPEDHVLDALDAAAGGALVVESPTAPGHFRFSHALIQHTIYEDLGATRQARLHQRAAAELETLLGADAGERVGELARHFLAGTRPAQAAKAFTYARLAGDRAMAAVAPDEAVRWYRQAIETPGPAPDPHERVRCLVSLGLAQRIAGHEAFHATLFEASALAQDIGDTEAMVRATLGQNRNMASRVGRVDTALVQCLEDALGAVGAGDSPERARLLASLSSELAFDPDAVRRQALAAEAVAVARRTGDRSALYDALVRPFVALCTADLAEFRVTLLREAVTLAHDAVDPDPMFRVAGHAWLALSLVEVSQMEGVDDLLAEVFANCHQTPTAANSRWTDAIFSCWREQIRGDTAAAEREAGRAFEVATDTGQPEAFSFYAAAMLAIRYQQGRVSEILPLARQASEQDDAIPALLASVAALEAVGGEPERAQALLDEHRPSGFDHPWEGNWLNGVGLWAEAAAEIGDAASAGILVPKLSPYTQLMPPGPVVAMPGIALRVARLYDVLGRPDDADRSYAQALEIHHRLESPFFVALTKACWALSLQTRDSVRARAIAREALAVAEAAGYADVVRKASRVLGSPAQH